MIVDKIYNEIHTRESMSIAAKVLGEVYSIYMMIDSIKSDKNNAKTMLDRAHLVAISDLLEIAESTLEICLEELEMLVNDIDNSTTPDATSQKLTTTTMLLNNPAKSETPEAVDNVLDDPFENFDTEPELEVSVPRRNIVLDNLADHFANMDSANKNNQDVPPVKEEIKQKEPLKKDNRLPAVIVVDEEYKKYKPLINTLFTGLIDTSLYKITMLSDDFINYHNIMHELDRMYNNANKDDKGLLLFIGECDNTSDTVVRFSMATPLSIMIWHITSVKMLAKFIFEMPNINNFDAKIPSATKSKTSDEVRLNYNLIVRGFEHGVHCTVTKMNTCDTSLTVMPEPSYEFKLYNDSAMPSSNPTEVFGYKLKAILNEGQSHNLREVFEFVANEMHGKI